MLNDGRGENWNCLQEKVFTDCLLVEVAKSSHYEETEVSILSDGVFFGSGSESSAPADFFVLNSVLDDFVSTFIVDGADS
jgi:hypothetical protein